MKLILGCSVLIVFAVPALSQYSNNENFEILRGYHLRIAGSLSFECVWFLSSLFGENGVFPSLPETSPIPTVEFVNPDVPQPFYNQQRLTPFFQNLTETNRLATVLRQCNNYDDNNTVTVVFLYNLLRNYVNEQQISTSAGKIKLFGNRMMHCFVLLCIAVQQ